MFVLVNNEVKLTEYKITYTENDVEGQENCTSEQQKNEVEQMLTEQGVDFTTEEIDQTGNEWFDGLEFESYDKALEVFNAGEEAYLEQKELQRQADNLKLRADIDYLSIMSGVDIDD